MPTYDYQCDACGHRFEKFQPITSRAIRKCPECGANAVRRLIGAGAGIIFKGSGFYQTDYRSDSYRKEAEKDKSGGDEAGKKDTKAKKDTSPTDSAKGTEPTSTDDS